MATLFDTCGRIVPAWLAAARHLDASGGVGRNLVLEMDTPGVLRRSEIGVLSAVSAALVARGNGLSTETIASTIFPQGLYKRRGRPAFYEDYRRLLKRAQKRSTWGLYLERMTRRMDRDGNEVNPLEVLIEKLRKAAGTKGAQYPSTYELSPSDPGTDLAFDDDVGAELATYEPAIDQNRLYGGPCLSHLSFKITDRTAVDLTAIYRSHRYCERALGNLLGLSRLHAYVAEQSTFEIGTLTCVSTHAVLDLDSWGGKVKGRKLLASLKP